MKESAGLWVRRFAGEPPPLVVLHGFTQTGEMYRELADLLGREVLGPDLPGHGRSVGVPASFASAVKGVAEVLAAAGGPVPLVGYSQGGRVALAVALERPELLSHLVLVSASAGIEDESVRAERRRSDLALVDELKARGLGVFLDRWLARPMFEGLERRGATWRATDRAARLENTAEGLAAALVGMGQGTQPFFGDRLGDLLMPVLVIAGSLDKKYASIATAMSRSLPHGTLRMIPDAGHAVVGEQPRGVADLVAGFLTGAG
ncbi:MAG: alpha/beta fold hydrolase [Acidimicrobiia bacterium]|nr:alpha/beta fold hydrolase [Acidimicrobiia bacterium]